MQTSFQNKAVLITGGTSGIGKALLVGFLQLGASVVVCGRDLKKLDSLKEELNHPKAYFVQADVGKEEECRRFVEQSFEYLGQIDILINNAGISMRALFEDADLKVIRKLMDINYWGTVCCTKFALSEIIKNQGSIIGISSIAGYKGLPARTGYSSSKFAMQGFLESLRVEMLQRNVHIGWVSPGFTASNIRNTALNGRGTYQGETPLDETRLMSAEECADRIIHFIAKRKRTLIMTPQGKLTVWLNKFFPAFMDRLVYNHFAKEPDSPLK